jgi:predicted nucleotidyltransferase
MHAPPAAELTNVLKNGTIVLHMRTTGRRHPGRATGAVELLFGDYRRRILTLLLLSPEDPIHVREIARRAGIPTGPLHRELKALASAGLLTVDPMGNQRRYAADRSHPIYPELVNIFKKTVGLADVLREAMEPLAPRIVAAWVFGSVASGTEGSRSDVDVLVVGTVSFASVVRVFERTHSRVGREVNPVVLTPSELRSKRAAGDPFVHRVIGGPKILLFGDPDDLGESEENRTAEGTRPKSRRDRSTARRRTSKPRRRVR